MLCLLLNCSVIFQVLLLPLLGYLAVPASAQYYAVGTWPHDRFNGWTFIERTPYDRPNF
jgi:hypothetical protein